MAKSYHSPEWYFGAKTVLRRLIDRVRTDRDIISKNDLTLEIYSELEDIEAEYNEQQLNVFKKSKATVTEIKVK